MAEGAERTPPAAFEADIVRLRVADLRPLRLVSTSTRTSRKYLQIKASIAEVGLVEPPVVARDRRERGVWLLLDGHLRVEALKELGVEDATCVVSIEDEAFTYNRRINRVATVQEHKMILNAIDRGVPIERLARALDVNVSEIRRKRNLLTGICAEAAELLKDRHVPLNIFVELRKLIAIRQIEAVELMLVMNKLTVSYAKALAAATPREQLVEREAPKRVKGLTPEQIEMMERETTTLDREFRIAERSYGADHLDLVVARGFLGKVLGNPLVLRYLSQHHSEVLTELEKIARVSPSAG